MHPAPFAYRVAHTVEEALELLRTHQDAKVLSGGQSLVPALKLRLTSPAMLVDISRIPGLGGISRENGTLRIGATATHRQVEKSPVVKEAVPVLAAIGHHVADVQVRHRGTFGGSLVHADPAADWPAGALAADATLVIAGPHGRREVHATEFFTGMLTTVVGHDELLVEIRLPANGAPGVYRKHANAASGFAVVGVAATATQHDGHVGHVTIGVTGATGTAFRATAAEQVLEGAAIEAGTLDHAASVAAEGLDCLSDIHAPAAYRQNLVKVLVRRALGDLLHV
jgi:carbon-monoxide dehydrogenase medium subunit